MSLISLLIEKLIQIILKYAIVLITFHVMCNYSLYFSHGKRYNIFAHWFLIFISDYWLIGFYAIIESWLKILLILCPFQCDLSLAKGIQCSQSRTRLESYFDLYTSPDLVQRKNKIVLGGQIINVIPLEYTEDINLLQQVADAHRFLKGNQRRQIQQNQVCTC